MAISEECATALQREFGYVPDEGSGEKWVVWRDHNLIVIHPERLVRVYRRGCCSVYYEIEPYP